MSSYISTTSATVTRSADSAIMTGSNFSSWWGATENTIVVTADSPAVGTRVIWQADDNTANNRITIYTSGTSVMADVVTGGVTQASLTLGTITANTQFKAAFAVKANAFAGCLNGGTVQTDSSGTFPTVDRCRIGSDTAGDYLGAHCATLTSYSSALANATLQTLST